MSWFNRLKSGLSRSTQRLTTSLTELVTHRKLDDATLQELEDILLQADMGYGVARAIVDKLRQEKFNKAITAQEITSFLAKAISDILTPFVPPSLLPDQSTASPNAPYCILVVGVNGSGKTTTIAKLGALFQKQGHRVRFGAGDTFRAAAVEQLSIWGERLGIPVTRRQQGADAAALCYDAVREACRGGEDVVLLDTAGRLHTNSNLMEELKKIQRGIHKALHSDRTTRETSGQPLPPVAVWLVLDATIGQNAYQQVDIFHKAVGLTGVIVTKLDGTAKGGVVVGLAEKFALPIMAVGVGEKPDDLRPFSAATFAAALVGSDDT